MQLQKIDTSVIYYLRINDSRRLPSSYIEQVQCEDQRDEVKDTSSYFFRMRFFEGLQWHYDDLRSRMDGGGLF